MKRSAPQLLRFFLLPFFCSIGGVLLVSCDSMKMDVDIRIVNDSDYTATGIVFTYNYVVGNTLFGDKDEVKKRSFADLPPGSRKTTSVTFSDPVLQDATSPCVIEYYLDGKKYGGTSFCADYPFGMMSTGDKVIFTIRNGGYEVED